MMTSKGEETKCAITKAMKEAMPMSRELCILCKGGRLMCGRPSCPLLQKIAIQKPYEEKLSTELFGPAPSLFVGWKSYPDVFVGPMTAIAPEKAAILDNPGKWYGSSFEEILEMRSMLVRSKKQQNIRERNRFLEKSQEVALSTKPIDVETHFKKKPTYNLSFSSVSQPMGPTAELKDFWIAENPKIPKRVDSLVSEGASAVKAAMELYENNYDVYYLTNVLSSGAIGFHERKKLVPTRWSITAVDDMIAKGLMEEIRRFPEINEFRVYENTYLENHFEVLMLPGRWEFEQFEAWAPKTLWTLAFDKPVIQEEYEPFDGRTEYAFKEGGGYYAGRFAVTEALHRMRRQARVIIFREIYEGYIMPVGVWEVRENVRKALEKQPKRFASLKDALSNIQTRLRNPIEEYLKKSELLKQRKLVDYF
jgi:hypothetical protein